MLLDTYGVEDEATREALFGLTRDARQRGWWTTYGPLQDDYLKFEAEASRISTYEVVMIPGLLQTPSYARAIQRGWLMKDEKEIERLVELRMERQKILTSENPPKLWAVIDEAALTRSFGSDEAKHEQLQRLIDTERMEHIVVQVLPQDLPPHPGLGGSFVILDYEEDPSLVYRETRPGSTYVEGTAEVEERRDVFQHLSATALGPDQSIAWLRRLASHPIEEVRTVSHSSTADWRKSSRSGGGDGNCVEVTVTQRHN